MAMTGLLAFRAAQFEEINCADCSVSFCMPNEMATRRRASHKAFYCPNGHGNYYAGKSEEEKLKENLAKETARLQVALSRENSERARADKLDKKLASHKKRAANGVCPCCARTFKQLAAHVKIKHPEYVDGQ